MQVDDVAVSAAAEAVETIVSEDREARRFFFVPGKGHRHL